LTAKAKLAGLWRDKVEHLGDKEKPVITKIVHEIVSCPPRSDGYMPELNHRLTSSATHEPDAGGEQREEGKEPAALTPAAAKKWWE
jgi:hypothetical protein